MHRSESSETILQPAMILIRPQMGENIGAAARAMLNFGLERMRLVSPRDGWPNPRAAALASGAGRILDGAGVYNNTADAVADCNFVFATTARHRDLTKQVMTPERAMQHTRNLLQSGQKVGILFGPERAGMDNEDIARANAIISIPVNPDFASLNLAQAVLLVAYEWGRQSTDMPPEVLAMARTGFAPAIEIERLGDHFEEELENAGFFFPEAKAEGMRRNLRNMWTRLSLTRADVQTLHGLLRQLLRGKETP